MIERAIPFSPRDYPVELVLLGAPDREELGRRIASLRAGLAAGPDLALRDVAWTAAQRAERDAGCRLAVVAASVADLDTKLRRAGEALSGAGAGSGNDAGGVYWSAAPPGAAGKLAWVFPGAAAVYPGMFRDLCLRIPEVRARFDLADRAAAGEEPEVIPGHLVAPPPGDAAGGGGAAAGLALLAVESGLIALLRELGVRADAAIGHDLGEIAALEAAGALPGEDETRIDLLRGLLRHLREAPGPVRLDRTLFEGAGLRPPRRTVYSCGTAEAFPTDPEGIADVAARGWEGPIRFRETIERMHRDGVRIFLEAGPGAALCRLVDESLEGREHTSVAVDRRGEPSLVTLHHALGRLAAEGVPLDLARLHRDRGSRTLDAGTWRPPAAAKRSHTVPTGAQAPQLDATAYTREVGTLARTAPTVAGPSVAASTAAGVGDDPVVAAYMESMSRFLATQEEIGRRLVALAGGAPAAASRPDRARAAVGAPTISASVALAESWLPPAAVRGPLRGRCVFTRMVGRPASLAARSDWLDAWANLVLSPAERERWTRLDRSPDGRVRWLSGRTAAKEAVRRLLAGGVSLADVVVAGERGERPTVEVTGREDRPAISIAHHRQLVVAVACDAPGASIGIDIEGIRRPGEDLREAALAPDEAARVPPGDTWFFRAWAAKEALAKALGSGVIPDPTRYAVLRVDPESGAVELQAAATRAVAMTCEITGGSPEESLALAVCQCRGEIGR